jgi:hypothetical protein
VIERPRLLPAVILGAMGLLALKLLAWTAEPFPGKVPASAPAFAAQETAKPEPKVWGLAKVIARAHAPDTAYYDPETTGSVDKPDPKKEQEKAEPEAKGEAVRAANPMNKAAIANGTATAVSPSERALLERLVVQQMNPRKMSEVLAAMAPERAEKLTVALAAPSRGLGVERVSADMAPLPGNELPSIAPPPRR